MSGAGKRVRAITGGVRGGPLRRGVVLLTLLLTLVPPTVGSAGAATPERDRIGAWSGPFNIGLVGIHSVVLHTGEVLLFSRPSGPGLGSQAVLVDPVARTVTRVDVPFDRNVLCAGVSALADGTVLFTGGGDMPGEEDGHGLTRFDPVTGEWSSLPSLSGSRWYPTNVQLGDGSTLIVTGRGSDHGLNPTMERYRPQTGLPEPLPATADSITDMYARMALLPDGRVFRAGPNRNGAFFDPGTDTWTAGPPMTYGPRQAGAMVLLPGLERVLTTGGVAGSMYTADDPTPTSEIVDLASPTPTWAAATPMVRPRMNHSLVLLADGSVLAVGGNRRGTFERPVREAEVYDSVTGTWSLLAAQVAQRGYHSTAVLLPDGRVLSAGSNSGSLMTTAEIFSPPYLFRGPRPEILASPEAIGYGESFAIETTQVDDIARVALIRPGSATHGIDFEQRYVDLDFGPGDAGGVRASAPSTGNVAPPGHYLLVVVNGSGVPSEASWVLMS